MQYALVRKTWRDDRRSLLGWAVGVAAFVTIYVGFYPQFQGTAAVKDDALPQGFADFVGIQNMTTPAGYLEATVYSLIGPLLLIMCGVLLAARTIARPEEEGAMELLLAVPLSRSAFARQRLAAAGVAVTAVAAIPWLLVTALAAGLDIDVPFRNIAAASVGLIALVWCFSGIAFLIGAATGRRGQVVAITGAVAVATYLLRALSGMIDGAGWLRWLTPFHYFTGADPLRTGFHWGNIAVLVAIAMVTCVAGIVLFERRDVGV
ncbi:ABC transporter permease subunit [Asanoa iriomotensis]|uniref:ABC-2 type transport system permease protein n=1 Tax=Asanoa iriomotensis TaxID=234613 RepID=A0ABQ4C1Y1_9ACTN|nr:ABC transporter permease subunit [Asanoa iriomotensis]GIF56772.1 hypothetical protein Air01nite_28670 [Asanoa iriomotensis]